jgi:hypothetical protein
MFKNRSYKLERLDTGDYTADEYDVCLSELRFINRYIGDTWALKATLLREIESLDLREFSVLDVGAGYCGKLRNLHAKQIVKRDFSAWNIINVRLNQLI